MKFKLMSLPVFRKGAWISYDPPSTGLEMWGPHLKLQVAAVYASCITKGYSKEKSSVFAECYANKQLYNVTYRKEIEDVLLSILV
jgi:hypothetical protein